MPAVQAITEQERALLNSYQRDFPLQARPYAAMADALGMDEDALLAMLRGLQERGILGRVGVTVRPNSAGASTLAALAVPPARLDAVADQVSALKSVNHNYAREHDFNLWFVLTAADDAGLDQALAEIASTTGLTPIKLPLDAEYHIDLGFTL
ncbi:MAG: Lrp/AsnC family transcriptional regulator [Rhodospirillaceae bacterium]|jgi:DNA-binding Lrp family transcriptional regulator|nr:Lrp/AsnC family transcriptional regulator [Rhodospirillaceae bacterium]MBT3492283.1 Lrp/AsnC family transcriptional regulator [Rhodospirillaceae bacterium]MBT3782324.1 Lrp/AsnC family transcriptional regulator [Rhodospirillaceae bacterium]MBT3975138.1 Lrp/AsnC family transcriptional regulator [Rhodospirillaceae bacterium]MBT4166776.1 Lrp/AsnC family transcriptional regulator [Rhodospirillaceae bacterium]